MESDQGGSKMEGSPVKYEWKEGSHIKADANVVGRVCEELEKEGRLNAQELVDVSRDEGAPMHDLFEWDDKVAAEKYRYVQAQQYIRSIVVRQTDRQITTRAFSSIANKQYVSTTKALSKADTRRVILRNAMNELRAFKSKYQSLKELDGVINAIDEFEREVA